MTRALEQKLAARWPTWFRLDGDPQETGMVDGFRCRDGWFELIWQLCEDLEPLVRDLEHNTGAHFEVLQVKEKFGGLRVYCNHRSKAIERRLELARLESRRICQVCGVEMDANVSHRHEGMSGS